MNIIESGNFILLVIFMATRNQKSTNYRQITRIAFLIALGLIVRLAYYKVNEILVERKQQDLSEKINQAQTYLDSFSREKWFDKLQYVKELESNNKMMPRSDHVNAIMQIFDEILAVDNSDTLNIYFSDFEISLENIRLNGHVSSLRILYQWTESKPALIQKFEELDFLEDISIKVYEKTENDFWYDFTLTANVINNGK